MGGNERRGSLAPPPKLLLVLIIALPGCPRQGYHCEARFHPGGPPQRSELFGFGNSVKSPSLGPAVSAFTATAGCPVQFDDAFFRQ